MTRRDFLAASMRIHGEAALVPQLQVSLSHSVSVVAVTEAAPCDRLGPALFNIVLLVLLMDVCCFDADPGCCIALCTVQNSMLLINIQAQKQKHVLGCVNT